MKNLYKPLYITTMKIV